ncbi:MAG: type IV pilus biogenesis protein PilM [Burkholderiales bacterium]
MRWGSAKKNKREPGWLVASLRPQELAIVHGHIGLNGKVRIGRLAAHALEGDYAGAERLSREWHLERYQCATLLEPGDYQLLLVEAPNVLPAELKAAIRWRIKDLLDYHVDDATIDVLDIPPDPSGTARSHSMYAVAARNEAVQACIERFDAAQIPLSVIDIAETAQRNIAALFEEEGRGVGLLYLGDASGLFTINYRRELYLARRIDIGHDQISAAPDRAEAFNRIALELTRTLDHFDRQFGFVPVNKLLLGPEPEESGLLEYLKSNLDIPISRVDLGATFAFDSNERPDPRTEWQRFHLIGASLRYKAKAP